jgi:hypothetical protein
MPLIVPDVVCMEMQPGEARSSVISIADLPAASQMSVALASGDPLMRVRSVSVFEITWRALTEEEINELPPRPPSIRENARKNGVEERVLVSQGGVGTLAVDRDHTVEITLDFSVSPQTPEGISSAQRWRRFRRSSRAWQSPPRPT